MDLRELKLNIQVGLVDNLGVTDEEALRQFEEAEKFMAEIKNKFNLDILQWRKKEQCKTKQ